MSRRWAATTCRVGSPQQCGDPTRQGMLHDHEVDGAHSAMLDKALLACLGATWTFYGAANAVVGVRRDARIDGYRPATTPVRTAHATPPPTDDSEMTGGQPWYAA